jgi:hypothetical protein
MEARKHPLTLFFCGLCLFSFAQPSRETLMALLGKMPVSDRLKTIYFDENGGFHAFPPKVNETVYAWLDSYLKK